MDETKSIYNMKLFDEIAIDSYNRISRVPGGWIYTQDCQNGTDGYSMTSCFVPYNKEFVRLENLTNQQGEE